MTLAVLRTARGRVWFACRIERVPARRDMTAPVRIRA
jgi:hypothetical protein